MISAVASVHGRSPARAFTLIEILVAVSILLLVAAVIVPFTEATLAERRFENTMDRVSGHLLSARLEAMERRLPIEVTWERGRMRTRVFNPDLVQSIPVDARDELLAETNETAPELETTDGERGDLIEELELPEGTSCRDSEPVEVERIPGVEDEFDQGSTSLRIAVYLPDGSVIERGPRWLVDADGRTAALWIDRRTGLPALHRRLDVGEADDETGEDAEVFDDLDDWSDPGLPGEGVSIEGAGS